VETASTTSFFALNLEGVDGLLLLGSAAYLEEPGLKQVVEYVSAGGVALCTASPQSPARQLLSLKTHGLLAARFESMRSDLPDLSGPTAVGWLNEDTAVGRLFAETADSDIFLLGIRDMLAMETLPPATDVVRTEEGHPLLVRQDVGKGSFHFLAVPLLSKWSDLPISMAFLPMVREILAEAGSDGREGVLRIECGEGLELPGDLAGRDDAGDLAGEWDNVRYDSEPRAGRAGGYPVEINVSRQESVPGRSSLTALRLAMTGSRTDNPRAFAADMSTDLRPYAAAVLMLLVAAEAALAARGDSGERKRRT
jgi:hypothetical protein